MTQPASIATQRKQFAANGIFKGNPCVNCLNKPSNKADLAQFCLFARESPDKWATDNKDEYHLKCHNCSNRDCFQMPELVKGDITRANELRRAAIAADSTGAMAAAACAAYKAVYVRIKGRFNSFTGVNGLYLH
ncbi:unnamed protein product [Zymoseptoria tritici ST99CH_1E4]|uniref:Uncharacterized protein n=1 Tax=Zymoseptoria tritici ST99CH_1E4 TaxID=1276532 RepID=A0A2H1FLK8_ZYMTR|nr:unnamed protein product [Zymoseptoria tritici ST99CH_1E4]